MAEKLGVSASLISEIERGARDPSKKILIDFRSEFNRDVEWLLTGIDSSDSVVQEKNQKISELEAIIAKKEQEIVAINQENKTLLTQLIETQAELVKALRK
jgi:transcriptional regulator with XRE-family HTH domain